MNKTIVIYHGGCRDGFCAAWVYWKYRCRLDDDSDDRIPHKNVIYHPGYYGQEPPDVKDCDVIIVDFSYDIKTMGKIYNDARRVTWLDHHKTAEPIHLGWGEDTPTHNHIFDNNRSGAGIAWDYFFPNQSRPWLVDYVEDRDLWRKKLHASDEVNAYVACLKFDFNIWDICSDMKLGDAIYHGKTAIMKTEQYVREVCKNVYFADINEPLSEDVTYEQASALPYVGRNIPIVNIAQIDCSEVLHELCKLYPESPFSLYWFKRADGMYQYGMRSIGDFDVSEVAKLFGGGGHKSAAGFQLNYLLEELK